MKKAVLLSCLLFCCNVFAWTDSGHEVVAEIAWQNMSKQMRQKVLQLLKKASDDEPASAYSFRKAATLLDSAKYLTHAFDKWHYIDYPIVVDPLTSIKPIDKENVVWALGETERAVQKFAATKKPHDDFDTVAKLSLHTYIHLVADIHQPLHCSSRHSTKRPNGDMGGNLYSITINGKPTNLHLFWDLGLGLFGDPGRRKEQNNFSVAQVQSLATRIMKEFPKSELGNKLGDNTYKQWAEESYRIASQKVYEVEENTTPSTKYIEDGQRIVKERIALAGYRLATQLTTILEANRNVRAKAVSEPVENI